jgi:PEGA domain
MLIRAALLWTLLVSLTCVDCRGQVGKESSNVATVHITSAPVGADIYVDGEFVGNTSSQIKLESGEHSVRIKAGEKEWSRLLQVTSGEVTIHADLSSHSRNESNSSTPDKQGGPNEEGLRTLAQIIKQCPQEGKSSRKWGKGPTEIEEIRVGPPENVEHPRRKSDSTRAPYAGYI